MQIKFKVMVLILPVLPLLMLMRGGGEERKPGHSCFDKFCSITALLKHTAGYLEF